MSNATHQAREKLINAAAAAVHEACVEMLCSHHDPWVNESINITAHHLAVQILALKDTSENKAEAVVNTEIKAA